MDGLDKIPAATAEDLRAFEVACGIESYPVTPWHRVAAHYKRRVAEAERLLRDMLASADCEWENKAMGHDWACAVKAARKFLEAK